MSPPVRYGSKLKGEKRVSESGKKRAIFVPEDLVKGLMEAASREGKPFNVFVEDVLHRVLKAVEMGYTSEKLTQFLEVVHAQRASSMTLIPFEVLKYMVSKVYPVEGDELQSKWYESGAWYGKYLKEKFDQPVNAVGRLLQATRWDLDEVNVKEEGGTVKFRCVSAILSSEGTSFLLKFIEGAMHGLGYRTENADSVRGIILLEFRPDSE